MNHENMKAEVEKFLHSGSYTTKEEISFACAYLDLHKQLKRPFKIGDKVKLLPMDDGSSRDYIANHVGMIAIIDGLDDQDYEGAKARFVGSFFWPVTALELVTPVEDDQLTKVKAERDEYKAKLEMTERQLTHAKESVRKLSEYFQCGGKYADFLVCGNFISEGLDILSQRYEESLKIIATKDREIVRLRDLVLEERERRGCYRNVVMVY